MSLVLLLPHPSIRHACLSGHRQHWTSTGLPLGAAGQTLGRLALREGELESATMPIRSGKLSSSPWERWRGQEKNTKWLKFLHVKM